MCLKVNMYLFKWFLACNKEQINAFEPNAGNRIKN